VVRFRAYSGRSNDSDQVATPFRTANSRSWGTAQNPALAPSAQCKKLSQMKSYLVEMRHDAQRLSGITTATDNGNIKSQLQTFASQYSDWIQRFDADMKSGGVLAGTRAARVSRYELDQSIKSIFNGASDGPNGLRDLGLGNAARPSGQVAAALAEYNRSYAWLPIRSASCWSTMRRRPRRCWCSVRIFAEDHKEVALRLMEGVASVLATWLRYTNSEMRALES
jgi:hypothetical protein